MRKTYLVDFENVQSSGLQGIDQLDKKDIVVIFYSECANKINMNVLADTKAKIKFIKADCGTANALDFQLVAYLCRKARIWNKFYIISMDRGYTPVINSLKQHKIRVSEAKNIEAVIGKEQLSNNNVPENIIQMDAMQNSTTEKREDTYYKRKIAENDPVTEIAVMIMEKIGVYPAEDMMNLIIEGLHASATKSDFYRFCMDNMGAAAGQTFYSKMKKVYEDMRHLADLVS